VKRKAGVWRRKYCRKERKENDDIRRKSVKYILWRKIKAIHQRENEGESREIINVNNHREKAVD